MMRNCLYSPAAAECARVDLVDTVLCEGGTPVHYLVTGPSGAVAARGGAGGRGGPALAEVEAEFLRLALAARGEPEAGDPERCFGADDAVALAHKQGGDVVPITLDKLRAMAKNGPPADVVALQAFVGRGPTCVNDDGSEGFASLRLEYSLNAVGHATHQAFRLMPGRGARPVPCVSKVPSRTLARPPPSPPRVCSDFCYNLKGESK